MKKYLITVMVIMILCMVFVGCTTAAGTATTGTDKGTSVATEAEETTEDEDVHSLIYYDAVAATCVKDGNVAYYYCSTCNKYYADKDETEELSADDIVIAATGHTIVVDERVEPTCTETGLTEGSHCSICDKVIVAQTTIAATGHTYVSVTTASPTCTETGTRVDTCSVCGEERTVTLPAKGHTAVSDGNGEEATCTTDGKTSSKHCSVCGELVEAQNTIVKLGHRLKETQSVVATCTEDGNVAYVYCTRCKKYFDSSDCENEIELSDTVIAALGHQNIIHYGAIAPACTTSGNYEYYYCPTCGGFFMENVNFTPYASAEDVFIAALGHGEETIVIENEVAATCTTAGGYDTVTYCSVCGEETERVSTTIDALGHDYDVRESVVATCTTDGYTTYVCSRCGDSYTDEYEAFGHTAGTPVAEDATEAVCTAGGQYNLVTYCTVCGEKLSVETVTVDALGHTYGDVVRENVTEATCTENGAYDAVVYCTVCGEELSRETVTVDALGHDLTAYEEVAATCTEDGHTAYRYCSRCEKYFSDEGKTEIAFAETVIGTTGHTTTHVAAAQPTCTTYGNYEYYYCSVCEKYFKDAYGAEEYEDGTSANGVWIAKTAHAFGEYTDGVAPTCAAAGQVGHYHCSACGLYYDEEGEYLTNDAEDLVLSALGHLYSNEVAEQPATCTETGRQAYYVCARCGAYFVSENGVYTEKEFSELLLEATGHDYSDVVAAVGATCTESGNVAYCVCETCGAYFDENHDEINAADVTVAAKGHTYVNGVCSVCGDVAGSLTVTTDDGAYAYEKTDGYEVYTITAEGSYVIAGEMTYGQIRVEAGEEDKVYLYLNGVAATNSVDSVLYVAQADKVYLIAVAGTTNVFTDERSSTGTYENTGSACIYSACDLNVTKDTGTIIVTSSYKNGIHVKKDLTIKKATLTVTATGDALKGEKSIGISSAATVTAISKTGDALKTKDTDLSSSGTQRGTISITGGTVYAYACCDAIDAALDVEISGDDTKVYLYTGDYATSKTSTYAVAGESAKGIKAGNDVTVSAGTVVIKASDDGIHANAGTTFDSGAIGTGNVTISGGSVTVTLAEDDGIVAEGDLNVFAGSVTVTSYDNGFSAENVNVAGGTVTVNAYAGDAVKATNGDVTVSGGTLVLNAAYDGISATDNVSVSGSTTSLTIRTSTYYSGADTSKDNGAYLIVAKSYVSSSYWYAVYFYNSATDYCWVTPSYKSYESSYYYYKFKQYSDDYAYYKVYRFASSVTEPDTSSYSAVSSQQTASKLATSSTNAFKITSVSGTTVTGSSASVSSSSAKGIEAYNVITLAEAAVDVKSVDDAIHANEDNGSGDIVVTSGTITLYSNDDAMHADNTLTISGGTVTVTYAYEGLEAEILYFTGGVTTVYATDDGVNASGSSPCIYVSGGTLDVTVGSGDTDGIDSNGNYVQTGGFVVTRDPTTDTSGNMSGLDIDGTCTITSGTFICAGTPAELPSSSSQCYVKFPCGSSGQGGGMGGPGGRPGQSGSSSSGSSGSYTFASGTWYVRNSSGTTLFSFTLNQSYKGLWICSSLFSKGNTYTITNGGTTYSWTQSAQATTYSG